MDMQSLLSEGCRILEEASKVIQEAAAQLSPPEIHPLNYRVATQICDLCNYPPLLNCEPLRYHIQQNRTLEERNGQQLQNQGSG